jgi:hypothetical protein
MSLRYRRSRSLRDGARLNVSAGKRGPPVAIALAVLATMLAALAIVRVAVAAGGLTGYGATRSAWAAHHRTDPNSKLQAGCCFLPKQADGTDRYYTVAYQSGRVVSYEMSFVPAVPRAVAIAAIKADVPRDTTLVLDKRAATCEFITWRSRLLKRAVGYSLMNVELSRTPVGGRYSGLVGDVLVGPGIGPTGGC